jgi:hypothetical protein
LAPSIGAGNLAALAEFPAWCFPPPLLFRHTGDTHEIYELPELEASPP